MFATFSRFRRHVAVLAALAMLASVLVAAPAVAAGHPEADYKATFSACVGAAAESSDFDDVPASHGNAGDIDCIAYYGITRGTSATTYSPLMSVTREQMALFLTRLAGRVGISLASDPADAGFTDTGDLSAESQKAINQLYALGITKGTSMTTYGPAGNVTRGHMALFIERLMNKMTPMADGKIGLSSTTQYGYIPSDVAANKAKKTIGTPFTDISGETPKDQYDAVTNLYELGVAVGVSDTSYAPGSDITRASMAGFMAAVMDHSNLRPSGLSIQVNKATVWGDTEPVVVASYRTATFGAVEGQAIDVFSSTKPPSMAIRKDGTCNFNDDPDDVYGGDLITGDCVWNDDDESTDADGNLFVSETDVDAGDTRTFYAWIGKKSGDKFDTDSVNEVTVAVMAKKAQDSLAAGADNIKEKALNLYGKGKVVDLRAQSSVTATATLKDEDGGVVNREGVSIRVHYRRGSSYTNTHEVILSTDAKGKVSYAVTGPTNTSAKNDREDIVEFVELNDKGQPAGRNAELKIHWIEEANFLAQDGIDVPKYVLAGTPSVSIKVNQWDQYGNPYRSHSKQQTEIRVVATGQDGSVKADIDRSQTGDQNNLRARRQVSSRGIASWTPSVPVVAEEAVHVAYDIRQLARNSKGAAVRVGTATNPNEVADFAAWVGLGSGSARMTVVDKLRTTYNDARVLVAGTGTSNAQAGTAGDHLHPDEINDDYADTANNGNTPILTDYAAPRGDTSASPVVVGSTDPFVYSAPRNAPANSNAEWSDALNTHALDTYQDYGGNVIKTDGSPAVPTQGLVAAPAPVALASSVPENVAGLKADGDASAVPEVWVVTKANSTNTGLYNVLLVGSEFLADTQSSDDSDARPELVFSFDDNDIFIDNTKSEGRVISIDRFRVLLKGSTTSAGNEVRVLTYDVDGVSTFSVRANTNAG